GRSMSTIAVAIVLVVSGLQAPARAEATTVAVTPAVRVATFGDQIPLAAEVTGDPTCFGPRPIELDRRSAADPDWTPVAQAATAADGTAAFSDAPAYTSSYRVSLPATATCPAVESDAVTVRVRVRIDSSLVGSSLTAGSCAELAVDVSPSKPGQTVELLRRTASGWMTVGTLTLDETSSASTRPCFGWDDIGIVRLRARWPAQDALNAPSNGPSLPFRITPALGCGGCRPRSKTTRSRSRWARTACSCTATPTRRRAPPHRTRSSCYRWLCSTISAPATESRRSPLPSRCAATWSPGICGSSAEATPRSGPPDSPCSPGRSPRRASPGSGAA